MEICPAYISANNSLRDPKQGKRRLESKLPALLRGTTSKHQGDICCWNCLHSFANKNKLKSHKKVCKIKCNGIAMPFKKNSILQYNLYMKSDKLTYILYADIESLIKKINGCPNNPEKSSTWDSWAYLCRILIA